MNKSEVDREDDGTWTISMNKNKTFHFIDNGDLCIKFTEKELIQLYHEIGTMLHRFAEPDCNDYGLE